MMILTVAKKAVAKHYICDNCLGRQFAQLLTGLPDQERGRMVRSALAMEYDSRPFKAELSNFNGFCFRQQPIDPPRPDTCWVCGGFFKGLDRWAERVKKAVKGIQFSTFLVGTFVPESITKKEEKLWDRIGLAWSEPFKSEANRELGKLLEKKLRKNAKDSMPDLLITVDIKSRKVNVRARSVYCFGLYQKLVRGIPQTKWDKYKESVEDIIAKPFMSATRGGGHALHGMGREDIDARCLGWRPFVLEIKEPKRRSVDLKKMSLAINRGKKVKVKDLKASDKKEVIAIKGARSDKSYRVLAEFEHPLKGLRKLRQLRTTIMQKTPKRVLHRRSDLLRKRIVKDLSWKKKASRKLELEVKGEAGLYIKELVTGDGGRTKPSVAALLNNPAKVLELDVTKIWFKEVKNGKIKQRV